MEKQIDRKIDRQRNREIDRQRGILRMALKQCIKLESNFYTVFDIANFRISQPSLVI